MSLKARPKRANSSSPRTGSSWSKRPAATSRARAAKSRSDEVSEWARSQASRPTMRIAMPTTSAVRARMVWIAESSLACG